MVPAVAVLAWERLLSDVPCSLPLVSTVAESLGMVATEDSSVDLWVVGGGGLGLGGDKVGGATEGTEAGVEM